MAWCEAQPDVEYVLGLAKNQRLEAELAPSMQRARQMHEATGEAARLFHDFEYRTLCSWSRARRVVGKAEWLSQGSNPRFIVTSLAAGCAPADAQWLYEKTYCGRGQAENSIKEQMELFADRTSCGFFKANQLRLYFSSFAYVMMAALRRVALAGTGLAQATCATIRQRLLKAGALIKFSVRRILVRFSSGWPSRATFTRACIALRAAPR
jgi:hypothetical protein